MRPWAIYMLNHFIEKANAHELSLLTIENQMNV